MATTLTYRQVGDVTVVDVTGMITLGVGSVMLRDGIRELIDRGEKKIILNMASVTYIDGSGLAELSSCFTSVSNAGGTLKLLNLTKRVQDLLQMTILYTIFEVFDDEETALVSFNR